MRGSIKVLAVVSTALGSAAQADQVTPTPVSSTPSPVLSAPMRLPNGQVASPHGPLPRGNPGNWVTNKDYPLEALRAGVSGVTAFGLSIDATGKPTECKIVSSSGSEQLDQTTCRLMMERAVFRPATDANGKPVTGSWSSRFRWIIPEEGPNHPIPSTLVRTFFVEVDGSVTNCTITYNSKDVTESDRRSPCSTGAKMEPYRSSAGVPQRRKVTMTQTISVTDPAAQLPVRKKKR